jgi:hypothetical protein
VAHCSRRGVRTGPIRTWQPARLLYSMLCAVRRLTLSMPWSPVKRRRRAASVDGVRGRAGAATSVQPGRPSVCTSHLDLRPRGPEAPFSAGEPHHRLPRERSTWEGSARGGPPTSATVVACGLSVIAGIAHRTRIANPRRDRPTLPGGGGHQRASLFRRADR